MKVYQVPMLFHTSSEFPENQSESTFIVLVFEKIVRKRRVAASKPDKDRIKAKAKLKAYVTGLFCALSAHGIATGFCSVIDGLLDM